MFVMAAGVKVCPTGKVAAERFVGSEPVFFWKSNPERLGCEWPRAELAEN
jgi:hypothetical protein